jgi:hypothetical protein
MAKSRIENRLRDVECGTDAGVRDRAVRGERADDRLLPAACRLTLVSEVALALARWRLAVFTHAVSNGFIATIEVGRTSIIAMGPTSGRLTSTCGSDAGMSPLPR